MSRCDQGEGGTTLLIGVSLTLIVDITKVPDFNKVGAGRDNIVSRDRSNRRLSLVTDVRVVRPVHPDVLLPVSGDPEDRSVRQH